ncbi:MAG: energy transducer TonB [Acidobacteriaceae bacterium]|nr:energy transducer TonB [Acidobacteriaceae bacterium]
MPILPKGNPSLLFVRAALAVLCLAASSAYPSHAEDLAGQVMNAVEKSTLDQAGTKPFHLKATLAPSSESDRATNKNAEIEIWWQSPTMWRREVRCPKFHQIAIRNGENSWQKNDGDYFPQWLEELVTAIIQPVPLPLDVLEEKLKTARVFNMGYTSANWGPTKDYAEEQAIDEGHIDVSDKTGLLLSAYGPGFGGEYHDFKDFHGRMIAMTVGSAKLSILEDLGPTPSGFFDTNALGGDQHPIRTITVSEDELRSHLISEPAFSWPPVKDGPFEGVVWTKVMLDRAGNIRDMYNPISDNPGLIDAAQAGFKAMRFKPILRDGVPVQATGRISVKFKVMRLAGSENFDSAKSYFLKGRAASFLVGGSMAPYKLQAEFQVASESGGMESGRYEDTWISPSEWKREVWLGSSHLVRSRSGYMQYQIAEGIPTRGTGMSIRTNSGRLLSFPPPLKSNTLSLLMDIIEPIPATDKMTESDWRIRRDPVDGVNMLRKSRNRPWGVLKRSFLFVFSPNRHLPQPVNAIRVTKGLEGPNGEVYPGYPPTYWFDDAGHLLKCYTQNLVVRMISPEDYNGVSVARQIEVQKDGTPYMHITVKEIGPADPSVAASFVMTGHEWGRAISDEWR